LEAAAETLLPDGKYWYDPVYGAFGAWGGLVVAAKKEVTSLLIFCFSLSQMAQIFADRHGV
jgi:hypothetical protein